MNMKLASSRLYNEVSDPCTSIINNNNNNIEVMRNYILENCPKAIYRYFGKAQVVS